jgi:N-6 DNA Methylase
MSDPQDELYQNHYAITGLFERLRADAGRHADTMDHRFGSWPQLLALFRMVHDGARHDRFAIPGRKGYLFNPDKYPFLEGRAPGQNCFAPITDEDEKQPSRTRRLRVTVDPPHVSDGVVFRVLQNLLILDGERLSYRTLDVEQIGSVYETIMGFILELAQGRSIAIKPTKPHGAPTTINLQELLAVKPADRAKWLKEQSDQAVTGQAATALKDAKTPEDAVAALEKKVARAATPNIVPPGAMILQPSEERRRSGSHYTPRSLTEPIVVTTFRPILERLGPNPTPAQILDLKVCDPAVGSGAFLVAVCRFLAELLVRAWHAHDNVPKNIPPDEDEILHARRIIAQRCLYGVDKNPMAVDLAKLSLWLATLAKDHPFTFLDHALRVGDSLVGLSKVQILGFHWKPDKQRDFARSAIEGQLNRALDQRRQIREAPEGTADALLREKLLAADGFINPGRRYGDLVVSAFFAADNDRKRKERIELLAADLAAQRSQFDLDRHNRLDAAVRDLRNGARPIRPFHWEIEFPEVFDRDNPGFDAVVGNPPFLGGLRISGMLGAEMLEYLTFAHEGAGHLCDVVAHFFRLAFDVLRQDGALGLLATNSIAQGDTRKGGLTWICTHGGNVFSANRRYRWPGQAAVVVSIVQVCKGSPLMQPLLDGRHVQRISSYLLAGNTDVDPAKLAGQNDLFSQGTNIAGSGFVIGDGEASSIENMRDLLKHDGALERRILPYLGGEEINQDPTQSPHRYVIYLSDLDSEEDLAEWPSLARIVREKVRPMREGLPSNSLNNRLKRRWWTYHADRLSFYRSMSRVMVTSRIGNAFAFIFLPSSYVMNEKVVLFRFESYSAFAVIQSRVHEVWARAFSSTLKDDLQYTPSDCFETFPFPKDFEVKPILDSIGRTYYEFRSDLMKRNNEGLTKTYNRFHDPDERSLDILRLRELHAAMDRAVLDAYGWTDLKPTCEFLLDYEEDEDDDESGGGRRRKKPWRYRWPDDFRDEVLARLLELNRQRAEEERLSGGAAEGSATPRARKRNGRKKASDQPEMF